MVSVPVAFHRTETELPVADPMISPFDTDCQRYVCPGICVTVYETDCVLTQVDLSPVITGIGIGFIVMFDPLSLLITDGFELTIRILYPVPAGVPIGIVHEIDPELVLLFVPIVVGDVNEPFLSDN